MDLEAPAFLWLPLLAVGAHLVEEFVWPGGFPEWYRWYRPERASSVTTRYLVIVNAVLVVLALLPPVLGATPRGVALWLMVAAIGAANALFHLFATVSRRRYSPGVVTGTVFYLPLAIIGYQQLVASGRVSMGTTIEAVVIGIGFHLWSAWNHKRRASTEKLKSS
ncbi:MAG TPA: HXXEE domain-containing protein [Gemmatimonadaceae bacterium]|nr:HXXEE domain-containing protein [Gemmatimonadaceae bacterium]